MNPTLGALRGAAGTRAGLSQAHAVGTATLQVDPPTDQQAEVQAAIAELVRDTSRHGDLIEPAHRQRRRLFANALLHLNAERM